MKKNKFILTIFLIVFSCLPLCAMDMGVILEQTLGLGDAGSGFQAEYSGILVPRLSILADDSRSLYMSAGIRLDYNNRWGGAFEILRSEFIWLFDYADLHVGRIQYSDPLGYIANGLLDGAWCGYDTPFGTFGGGLWYTGLLYKKRANITMTDSDLTAYREDDSYHASKRILFALEWEHPALMELFRTQASFMGQFDVNGNDDWLHTQYLAAKLSMPYESFLFDLGGSIQLAQYEKNFGVGFSVDLGASWDLPTPFTDRLMFLGRFSTINQNSAIDSIWPVTKVPQGKIFNASISDLNLLSLDYLVRFHDTFSAGLTASWFVTSDIRTNDDARESGIEFFGTGIWSPLSDIMLNVGGGFFIPFSGSTGRWRIDFNAVISLY